MDNTGTAVRSAPGGASVLRRWTVEQIMVVVVLLAALCQATLGGHVSKSGEQLGLALPVATLVIAIAAAVQVIRCRGRTLPIPTWEQVVVLTVLPLGLLGMSGSQLTQGAKEMVQLGEALVVAVFLFRVLKPDLEARRLIAFLGITGFGLSLAGVLGLTRFAPLGLSARRQAVLVVACWPFILAAATARPGRQALVSVVAAGVFAGLVMPHGWFVLLLVLGALLAWRVLPHARRNQVFLACALAVAVSFVSFSRPWARFSTRFRDTEYTRREVIEAEAALRAPRHVPLGGGLGQYKPTINRLKQYGTTVPHPEDQKVGRDGNSQYLLLLVEAGAPGTIALALFLLVAAGLGMSARNEEDPGAVRQLAGISLFLVGLSGAVAVILGRGSGIWLGAMAGLAWPPQPPGSVRRYARWLLPLAAAAAGVACMLTVHRRAPSRTHANRVLASSLFGDDALGEQLRVVVLPDDVGGEALRDLVRVEAESAVRLEPPFAVAQVEGASGNRAVVVPEGAGKGMGDALYVATVEETGTYVVFARVWWDDGCGNSLQIVGPESPVVLTDDVYERWHMVESRLQLDLAPGDVEFRFRNLEDGIRVDYWGLRRIAP